MRKTIQIRRTGEPTDLRGDITRVKVAGRWFEVREAVAKGLIDSAHLRPDSPLPTPRSGRNPKSFWDWK